MDLRQKKEPNMFGSGKSAISAMPIADSVAVFNLIKKSAMPIADSIAEKMK